MVRGTLGGPRPAARFTRRRRYRHHRGSPVVSATSLAQSLGIAVKNAAALLDAFVARDIAIEATHRSKRRLYGLKHLAPLREEAAAPRRPMPGRGRGRPPRGVSGQVIAIEYSEAHSHVPPLANRPPLTPLERQEFDFTDLDKLMRQTDQAIRRAKAVLDELAARPDRPGSAGP